ncbi:MAG: hypothetical protein MUE96_06970 [Bacteroidia bacterium]|nr:hypothetical protein [Bacteroidia bacterium]
MKNKFWLCAWALLSALYAQSQSVYMPLNSYGAHVLDRMEIKQGRLSTPAEFMTGAKAYKRKSIALYVDSLNTSGIKLSKQDYFNLSFLQTDNFEYTNAEHTQSKKPIWKTPLYKYKASLYAIRVPDLTLVFNPVAYLQAGYDQDLGKQTFVNGRGLDIRGTIGKNVAFYTQVTDEIQQVQSWNLDYYNAYRVLPGEAFLKTTAPGEYNYINATGYVAIQMGKYFDFQFGHGRNFIGNGYRSLMMSDFSRDHLFGRLNTRIWKINYSNIWGELYDYTGTSQNRPTRRHYFATTYLNTNITRKLNIGLFQTISFDRDSGFQNNGYDWQYLNPIIFYKPIENGLNSPDKTILGADFKYNFARHFSLYGQFLLSELRVGDMLARNGWHGNKYAYQAGIKYIDVVGIQNLDLQLEYNVARPYMYTSFRAANAYVNYNQNMAHPMGANFKEGVMIWRYQPAPKWMLTSLTIMSLVGNDTNNSNWGRDIRKSYRNLEREYGNTIGQGVRTEQVITNLVLSYMFWHNMFIEGQITYRKTTSALPQFANQTLWGGITLRINMNQRVAHY